MIEFTQALSNLTPVAQVAVCAMVVGIAVALAWAIRGMFKSMSV